MMNISPINNRHILNAPVLINDMYKNKSHSLSFKSFFIFEILNNLNNKKLIAIISKHNNDEYFKINNTVSIIIFLHP